MKQHIAKDGRKYQEELKEEFSKADEEMKNIAKESKRCGNM